MTANERSLKHRGARLERRAWLAYLRRHKSKPITIEDAVAWGLARVKRYEARPGGLGRR